MDAWETLVSGSELPSGDAWEHLNNQSGTTLIYGPIDINVATTELTMVSDIGLEANITSDVLEADVDLALTMDVTTPTLEVDL